MINELTDKRFKSTMNDRMINVTDTAYAIVDIWPGIAELNNRILLLLLSSI